MKESASLEETAKKLEIELQGPDIRQINRQDLAQEKFSQNDFFHRMEFKMNFLNFSDWIGSNL